MALLFVASEADELKPFAQSLTGLRKLSWPLAYAYEGILGGQRIMLVAHGAGPKLAAQAVEIAIRAVSAADLSSSVLEGVFSVGYCGALQSNLRENDIVVPETVLDGSTGEQYSCMPVRAERSFTSGRLISQDRIFNTASEKGALGASGSVAVDMEAGGVAARSKRGGLPFGCIKVVSDRADESFPFDLNMMRSAGGRIARGKIVAYVAARPVLIPGLLRLRRRARDAAEALGEFLVSCRIDLAGEPAGSERE